MGDPSEPLQVVLAEDGGRSTAPFWADLAFKWSGAVAFLCVAAAAVKYLFA